MPEARRLNVMLFGNDPSTRGGAEEHMLLLARCLQREQFRVILACPPAVLEKFGSDIPSDVVVEPIEFYNLVDLKAAWKLATALRRHRIDILHSHMFHASLVASPVGRVCQVSVVLETPHVREDWRTGWKRSYLVDRLVARTVDGYIAVSLANAEYLVREKRLPASKIRIVRNGIDTERFCPKHAGLADFRKAQGLVEADSVIVVLARLEPQKGHSILLTALSSVCQQFPGVRVVFLGEGSLRNELEVQAKSLGLGPNVHFAGFQKNIPEWLAVSEFTVLPSLYEGLPLAAIESLAAAKPVIASAVDGTPEVVLNERTGLLVPSGNVSALATAMRRFLRDREWTRQLGITGRKWVVEKFSAERQIRETEAFYFDAWNSKRATRIRIGAQHPEAKSV
jgi:glycosyltransferase involved in cell wall biosynthesis